MSEQLTAARQIIQEYGREMEQLRRQDPEAYQVRNQARDMIDRLMNEQGIVDRKQANFIFDRAMRPERDHMTDEEFHRVNEQEIERFVQEAKQAKADFLSGKDMGPSIIEIIEELEREHE